MVNASLITAILFISSLECGDFQVTAAERDSGMWPIRPKVSLSGPFQWKFVSPYSRFVLLKVGSLDWLALMSPESLSDQWKPSETY